MSIFRRRRHRSSKPKNVEPEVILEVQEQQEDLNQLQNILMKRKRPSKPKNSLKHEEESAPDFKDALKFVMDKRRRKLERRKKVQTCGVNDQEEILDLVPEEVIEDSIPIEQVDTPKPAEVKPPIYKKPKKKKEKAKETAKPKASTAAKKAPKASVSTAKPKRPAATAAKPKKTTAATKQKKDS